MSSNKRRESYDPYLTSRNHMVMQQQEEQNIMKMHLMRQHHQFQMHQWHMMQQMRPVVENVEFPIDNRRDNGEGSSREMALPVPRFKITNLDRLMLSVTPFVPVEYLPEESNGSKATTPFFRLGALWESFNQWSAYGAGVPLLLNGQDLTDQYYVPFLSGIELYTELPKELSQPKLTSRSPNPKVPVDNISRLPVFQYLEREPPHTRKPLTDVISLLDSQHPELSKYRSCDLLPSSWISVAWYPIYRIPLGPTMEDLEASFLTLHSLSTHPTYPNAKRLPPIFHAANTRRIDGSVDPVAKFSLPVFGLASYKLRGSLMGPCGIHEYEQERFLWKAADDWLKTMPARLPDYDFFCVHSSYRRRAD